MIRVQRSKDADRKERREKRNNAKTSHDHATKCAPTRRRSITFPSGGRAPPEPLPRSSQVDGLPAARTAHDGRAWRRSNTATAGITTQPSSKRPKRPGSAKSRVSGNVRARRLGRHAPPGGKPSGSEDGPAPSFLLTAAPAPSCPS